MKLGRDISQKKKEEGRKEEKEKLAKDLERVILSLCIQAELKNESRLWKKISQFTKRKVSTKKKKSVQCLLRHYSSNYLRKQTLLIFTQMETCSNWHMSWPYVVLQDKWQNPLFCRQMETHHSMSFPFTIPVSQSLLHGNQMPGSTLLEMMSNLDLIAAGQMEV